jgi:hypothetical protein
MRLLVALVLWFLSGPAFAEVVSIRSGQHDRFTRLVLAIPVGRPWTLGRVDGGYALVLGDGQDSFDTSTVFDRVPANRIAAIADEGGSLRIDLACDCHADAFLWRPDRLVVDVIDGPPPEGSEFEVALDMAQEESQEEATPARAVLPVILDAPSTDVRAPLLPGTFAVAPPSDDRVADAERAIIESLARAANQGVFDIASRVVPIVPDNLTEDGATPPAQLPVLTPVTDPMDGVPTPLPGPAGEGGPGLILRTGIERSADGEQGTPDGSSQCISDEALGIDTWGDERDFSEQIADHRRILSGEFDVIPEGASEALAKTYLYFGFGQEARQALALDENNSQERLILEALSRVVDDVPQRGDVLGNQIACPGFVALWSALANGSLEGTTQDGRNAAVMAFRLLPDHLRGHLGARLAKLFLDAGDPTTADIVLTATRRLDTGDTTETDLTSAAVIETTEGVGPAIEALDAMAEGDTRMTADGLVRLINLMVTDGQMVDDATLELAATMRFEARGSEDARSLGLAEVLARTARDDFETALALVLGEESPFDDTDRAEQGAFIVKAMAEREETAPFLSFAFRELPQGLPADAENAVAARLLAVGFPERALAILSSPATDEAMAERRYLRAEAAAALGDMDALEEALSGLNDARATQIRSAALAASGDFQSALAEDQQSPGTDQAADAAWRAGAWSLLEAGEDPLLQAASRAILTEPSELPSPPTLAARRDLLEEAQATRALTEELLGRFSVEEPPVEEE